MFQPIQCQQTAFLPEPMRQLALFVDLLRIVLSERRYQPRKFSEKQFVLIAPLLNDLLDQDHESQQQQETPWRNSSVK